MSKVWVKPVVLENDWVRLEPVRVDHAADLAQVANLDIFRYFVTLQPRSCDEKGMTDFIERSILLPKMLPFATIDKHSGRAVGMTSYLDIRSEHKGIEIGYTWIGPEFQKTKVNPAAKLLQLAHAFDILGANRVQLKTDSRNLQSQGAMEKMGAQKEGILRQHLVMPDGHLRDTVMYSILPNEWPEVKKKLLERLGS